MKVAVPLIEVRIENGTPPALFELDQWVAERFPALSEQDQLKMVHSLAAIIEVD